MKNVATLLKPGGHLQWVETDFASVRYAVRLHLDSETTFIQKGLDRFLDLGKGIIGEW